MKTSQYLSNYLKADNLKAPQVVTIRTVKLEELKRGDKTQARPVLYFKEFEQGMILNATNNNILRALFGSDESDEWAGKQVELYVKADVEFAGKIMPGLRLRAIQ